MLRTQTSIGEPTHQTHRSRRDRGMSFVEVLVAVVLIGTTGVAVLAGMAATLRSTAVHDRLATVQARLSNAGDLLTDVTLSSDTYVSCATPGDYDALVSALAVSVTAVEFWDGAGWQGSCSGASSSQLQKLTLHASIEGVDRDLVVVKRKATVAATPGGSWNDGMVSPLPNPGF